MKIILTEHQYNLIKESEYNQQLLDLINNGQFELANTLIESLLGMNIYSFIYNILVTNDINKNYTVSSSDVGNFNANEHFTFNVTDFKISPNLNNEFIYDDSNRKIKSFGTIKFYVNIDGSFSDWDLEYVGSNNTYNIRDYININEHNKSEISYYIKNILKYKFKFLQYFNLNIIYMLPNNP